MKLRIVLLILAASMASLTAACSSSGSDSESKATTTVATDDTGNDDEAPLLTEPTGATDEEVSASVQEAFDVPPEKADCVATELRGLISADQLQAVADGNQDGLESTDLDNVRAGITAAFAACP